MGLDRFNKTATKILQALTEAQELNVKLPSRPSDESLLDFINEAQRAYKNEPAYIEDLTKLQEERDALKTERDRLHSEITQFASSTSTVKQIEAALVRAVGEADVLRARLDAIPGWIESKSMDGLTEEQRLRLAEAGQWVMLLSPSTDHLSWFTIAETLMKFDITKFVDRLHRGVVIGTRPSKQR